MKEDIRDEVRAWYMGVKSQTGKFPDLPSEESGGSAVIYTRYKTASSHSKSTSQSSSKGTKSLTIYFILYEKYTKLNTNMYNGKNN